MDLFDYMRKNTIEQEAPLASRLRPSTLDEVVGQKHIIGKDKLLYRAIKADKLGSLIFYGPPGTGKTTLARVIANTTSARFEQLNATVAGKKDMEQVVQDAKDALGMYGKRTILFIDEIHRFNKGQQDYLLPFVEDGTILLIGATTENPYFEVNGALISRSRIFELKPLENADIRELLERAIHDKEKGMGSYRAEATDEAKGDRKRRRKMQFEKMLNQIGVIAKRNAARGVNRDGEFAFVSSANGMEVVHFVLSELMERARTDDKIVWVEVVLRWIVEGNMEMVVRGLKQDREMKEKVTDVLEGVELILKRLEDRIDYYGNEVSSFLAAVEESIQFLKEVYPSGKLSKILSSCDSILSSVKSINGLNDLNA